MSEEVVLGSELETGVFFTLYADGVLTMLDKDGARKLRDELNEFIGEVNKTQARAPRFFEVGCSEPDVPVGTKLRDNTGDLLMKVNDNPNGDRWRWVMIGGEPQSYEGKAYSWSFSQDKYSFTEVIE